MPTGVERRRPERDRTGRGARDRLAEGRGRPAAEPVPRRACKQKPSDFPVGFRNAQPCASYWGQLTANVEGDYATKLPIFQGRSLYYAVCGYTPKQLRSAYGVPAALTGKGVTVAVIDAYQSPTLLKDANRYAKDTGGKPFATRAVHHASGPTFPTTTRTPAARRAGRPSSPWTSRRCMASRPTRTCSTPPAPAATASTCWRPRSAVIDDNRASIVSLSYGGSRVQRDDRPGDVRHLRCSSRPRCRASASTSPPVTTVTRCRAAASSRSTPRRTTPTRRRSAAPRWRSGRRGSTSSRPAGAPMLWSLAPNGKSWVYPEFHGGAGGGFSRLFAAPAYQTRGRPGGISPGAGGS